MASFTERYHELTKYNPHTIDKLGPVRWETQPPLFKSISSTQKIDLLSPLQVVIDELDQSSLPEPNLDLDLDLDLDLEDLARLLFFTLGLTARLANEGGEDFYFRAAPSAGGLYPTEIYIAVRNQSDIPNGIYHYHSLKSALIPVWQGSFWGDLKHYFLGHEAIESSNLIVLFTGLYGRSAWRYKERAYRRILLDSGHALGNLLEVCRSRGLDAHLMGGFVDEGLEELLFLTPKEEFPLLGIAIGSQSKATTDGLSKSLGQVPGPRPEEAIQYLSQYDPMQVQQNSCERIRLKDVLRQPVEGEIWPTGMGDDAPWTSGPFFNVLKTILNRRSCRKFNGESVSLTQLQENLAFAYRPGGNAWRMSGPHLETHVVALNVEDLASGVYAFDPLNQTLDLKRSGDFRPEVIFMCLGQDLAADCAYVVVHTADLAALVETFGDRGYRYACMDAGQIGERMNLWAVHQELGSSGIGGYYDDQANELLQLPLSDGILYISLVGVPDGAGQ